MSKFKNQKQSGQTIVLYAILIVILLGSLGLAIDGGGMFLLHRDAQNAVDAAALAAAFTKCTGGNIEEVAYDVLESNGFTVGTERVVEVIISTPPINGNYAGTDADQYIEVQMTAKKPSYFIQLIYGGPLIDTVNIISRCEESYPSAANTVITALRSDCQNAVDLSGSNIQILGGILSAESIKVSTSSGTIIGEGWYTNTYEGNENTLWSVNPDQFNQPIVDDMPWEEEQFRPGGVYYQQAESEGLLTVIDTGGTVILSNGVYEGLMIIEGAADVRSVGQNITIGPRGFTIVALGGSIAFSGNSINLTPYVNNGDNGLLLYSTATTTCGSNAISFSSSDASWSGDLYAPNGGIQVSDNNNTSFDSRIVGGTVNISANNTTIGNEHVSSPWTTPSIYLVE